MNVELSEQARATVDGFVRQGDFASPAEVIDAALALLAAKQNAYWERADELVEEGIRDLDEGRSRLVTRETALDLVREIEAAGLARLAAKRTT